MENFNAKEYINKLIETFNKYDYYTNDHITISSLVKLNKVKTNNDLLNCLKDLNDKNLIYQFLHQESYLNAATKEVSTKLDKTFAKLINYLEKNPKELISKPIELSIQKTDFNISYLTLIEKSLDKNLIKNSINLAETIFENISVNKLYYPIIFNEHKKLHDAIDYFGRFSKNEWMIEIPQVDKSFKQSTLTHESFHALDTYIFYQLEKKYEKIDIYSKEFTSFVSEINGYDKDLIEVLNIPLEKIKQDEQFKGFFDFCVNFDKIPQSKKLSKEDTKEYIEKYLNIDISKCKDETDFTQQVLEIYSSEKNKLSAETLKIIPNNTEKIKLLSKEMFNYYHTNCSDKSMYALMSSMISKLVSEKDDYRCSLNEKCARVFEMNSYSNNNTDVYKLLSDSISEKNIYPIGQERVFYVNYLNNELKNISNLLNEHIFVSVPLPKPQEQLIIPKGFENNKDSTDNYDIANLSKLNIICNVNKIRNSQNIYESYNRLKIK